MIRIHPPCDSCTIPDDFEGPTDGSSVFPDRAVGATRTVKLRVRPYLGKLSVVICSFKNIVEQYCGNFGLLL